MKIINDFKVNSTIVNKIPLPVEKDGKLFWNPRPWQSVFSDASKREKYNALIAPPGAGKSMAIAMSCYDRLISDKNKKAIVVCPQRDIVSNYEEINFMLGKNAVSCKFKNNLNESNKQKSIYKFLTSKASRVNDRLFSCTHSSICLFFKSDLYKSLTDKEKKALNENVILWVDEAHHMSVREEIYNNEIEILNSSLADVVKELYNNGNSINFSSATPYRSDGSSLIDIELMNEFKFFNLDTLQHLEQNCIHLKSLDFNTVFYDDQKIDYPEAVADIFRQYELKPTIIYIPTTGSNNQYSNEEVSTDKKIKEVQDLINSLKVVEKEMGVKFVIKDLVTDNINGKDPREEYELQIKKENKKANAVNFQDALGKEITSPRPEINIIIAMRKFREGSDYAPLARIIEVGTNGSLTSRIQTTGRVLRDYHKKESVEIFSILKGTFKRYNDESKIKECIEETLKHMFISLMMENELATIPLSVTKRLGFRKGASWEKDIDDAEKALKIQSEIHKLALTDLANVGTSEEKWIVFEKLVEEVLDNNGITHKPTIRKCVKNLKMRWGIKVLQMKGVNYDGVTWNLIDKVDPRQLLEVYLSKSFEKREINRLYRTTGFGKANHVDMVLEGHHLTSKFKRLIDWKNPKSKEESDYVKKYHKIKFAYEIMKRERLLT